MSGTPKKQKEELAREILEIYEPKTVVEMQEALGDVARGLKGGKRRDIIG